MPDVVFSVDQGKSMREQAVPGHNRWHPDIPMAAMVRPGDEFRVECREWTDAQIGNNDSANDVRDVDLTHAHMLSGPIGVEGAQPGDLLVVDILDLGPVPQEVGQAPGQGWGYTGIFAKANGGGFLTDYFPGRVQGDLGFPWRQGHIPPHARCEATPASPTRACSVPRRPRICWRAGTAGSRRSSTPIRTGSAVRPATAGASNTLAGRPTAAPAKRIAAEGARTVPARENGGNHDIKNFTRGARVFYPVLVKDAKLSGGDLHFSQGDGEITFCGAIRDGRLHRLPRRSHQGRYGEVRGHDQPGLHARQCRAAVLGVPHVHRCLR